MRAVIQRVSRAEVRVDGAITGKINHGLVILLAVETQDTESDLKWIMDKICVLRIFSNDAGKFDLSLEDVKGSILLVSQFTLYGNCNKGRRPSFDRSAPPNIAERLYQQGISYLREKGIHTETGKFGAMMDVDLINDGPVTLILDSPNK
jgi:D-tyrosyl-tRNA(Tyr) deacylase